MLEFFVSIICIAITIWVVVKFWRVAKWVLVAGTLLIIGFYLFQRYQDNQYNQKKISTLIQYQEDLLSYVENSGYKDGAVPDEKILNFSNRYRKSVGMNKIYTYDTTKNSTVISLDSPVQGESKVVAVYNPFAYDSWEVKDLVSAGRYYGGVMLMTLDCSKEFKKGSWVKAKDHIDSCERSAY